MTPEDIREYFEYSFTDGHLYWRKDYYGKLGQQAGTNHKRGYRVVMFKRKSYLEHRLIWLWRYGTFEDECIDHINRNTSDNHLHNLRCVSMKINMSNKNEIKSRSKQKLQKQRESTASS